MDDFINQKRKFLKAHLLLSNGLHVFWFAKILIWIVMTRFSAINTQTTFMCVCVCVYVCVCVCVWICIWLFDCYNHSSLCNLLEVSCWCLLPDKTQKPLIVIPVRVKKEVDKHTVIVWFPPLLLDVLISSSWPYHRISNFYEFKIRIKPCIFFGLYWSPQSTSNCVCRSQLN